MGVQQQASPTRHWSTEQVERRLGLAYWIDTVCDRFMELEIDTPLRDQFRARLEQTDLGPATVNLLYADRQRIRRTPSKIAMTHYPLFHLMQLREGSTVVRQLGREVTVRAGECVLINGTEPYEIDCPQPTTALVLAMPNAWLTRWVQRPERCTVRVLSGPGWSLALNAALESLEVAPAERLALSPNLVAEQIASLLALAVGPEVAAGRPVLLNGLMNTLRDRFHEADLTAADVAAAHHISLRTLHYAFARAGKAFAEELLRLRLEHAQQMLSNPKFAHLPVSEASARSGFVDPGHFARRFRRQFGQSPCQFRRSTIRSQQ